MSLSKAIIHFYIRFILFSGLLASSLDAGAATGPSLQEKAGADRDFAAFEELRLSKPPGKPSDMGWEAYVRWGDSHSRSVSAAAIHFYQAHPQDPRRWDVLMAMLNSPPLFAKGFRPDVATKGAGAAIIDEQAREQWNTEAARLRSELIAAPDSKPEQREMADFGGLSAKSRALGALVRSGREHNPREAWLDLLAGLDEHFSRFAGSPRLGYEVQLILSAWDRILPGSMQEACLRLASSKDDAVRRFAEDHLKNSDLFSKPLKLSFTALDGRKVDLEQLRGKVVLIDFWATWCGPCKAEIPNVLAVYKKYHDRGFEVIGISLDKTDAKQALINYTKAHEMPWPQYFDGKYRENEISTRFGINVIPAMFLLGKDGTIISTNARGPKLEEEVSRGLGL